MVLWIICNKYKNIFFIGLVCLLHHYLDDFIFGHVSLDICNAQYNAVKKIFDYLGIPTQDSKMNIAAQINVFIGFIFNLIRRGISMPSSKLLKCKKRGNYLLKESRHGRNISIIYIQRFVGIARHVCRVYYWSIPCLRGLEELCNFYDNNHKKVKLTKYCIDGINTFLDDIEKDELNFIPFKWILCNKLNCDIMMSSDGTTKFGIGGLLDNGYEECYQLLFSDLDFWPVNGRIPDIIFNELIGLVIGVFIWSDYFSGRCVRANCDNFAIVKCLRRRCACFARKDLNGIISKLCKLCKEKRFYIHFEWVAGVENVNADILSRDFEGGFFKNHKDYITKNNKALNIAKECIDIFKHSVARMESRYVNGNLRKKKCYCDDRDLDEHLSICKRQPLYI